ncbi:MAG: RNA polymerase sigma factor [Ilumatobacteraceae bacterium]
MVKPTLMAEVSFESFVADAEPRLRRVFVARYGVEHGNDVTADVLAYAWEHWQAVAYTTNPLGYLYRVGQSRARRYRRWERRTIFPPELSSPAVDVEPGLERALSRLSEDQRVAVLLVHSYGWTYAAAAEVLGIAPGLVVVLVFPAVVLGAERKRLMTTDPHVAPKFTNATGRQIILAPVCRGGQSGRVAMACLCNSPPPPTELLEGSM